MAGPGESAHFILATAGHVDHGKTALVRALTGTDTDRLPEEKRRGITIELGFAELTLPLTGDAVAHIGIVDVPGHEDFVKNMVAGVGSADAALLVVAANERWMPQTEEHLQILTYLGVTRAVVALTKADLLADESALAAARAAVRAKLAGSPLADASIVPTSIVSNVGLSPLRNALASLFAAAPRPADIGKPRLAIDRAFTLKGVGTVVTGTLAGGTLARGQRLVIQPGGVEASARSIQMHGRSIDLAPPGARVAINLPNIAVAGRGNAAGVRRGNVLTTSAAGGHTRVVDVQLWRVDRPATDRPPNAVRNGVTLAVHHGSGLTNARIRLLNVSTDATIARLAFATPVHLLVGDRIVFRDAAGQHTLAGGVVLDADPPRRRPNAAFLTARATGAATICSLSKLIQSQLARDPFVPGNSLGRSWRYSAAQVERAAYEMVVQRQAVATASHVVDTAAWQSTLAATVAAIDGHQRTHSESVGLPLSDLRAVLPRVPGEVVEAAVTSLCGGGEFVRGAAAIRRTTHRPALPVHLRAAGERLRAALAAKPLEPANRRALTPDPGSRSAMHFLLQTGEAVALGDELVLLADTVEAAKRRLTDYLQHHGPATAGDLRQALGTTRRVMMPLLEYFDRVGVTARRGDLRVLRR